jgi:hypothetical protein
MIVPYPLSNQMDKVELERLSGNSEQAPIRGSLSLQNDANWHLLGASRYQETCHSSHTATFQTVSGRVILRSSAIAYRARQLSRLANLAVGYKASGKPSRR